MLLSNYNLTINNAKKEEIYNQKQKKIGDLIRTKQENVDCEKKCERRKKKTAAGVGLPVSQNLIKY